MSAIAFTDDAGNAWYALPEGGYSMTDPTPPATAAGDWWTNAPYINQTPYKLNPNTGKPELMGMAKVPGFITINMAGDKQPVVRGEEVPESVAKSMGVSFQPLTPEQFKAPKNDFDIGGALLASGMSLFGYPALATALGGGALGTIGSSLIGSAITGQDPLKAIISSGLGAGISSGLSALDVPTKLIPAVTAATKAVLTDQNPLTAALGAAVPSAIPSITLPSFSSQTAETAPPDVVSEVTAPSMIDQEAIDLAQQPVTGLGSLINQADIDAAQQPVTAPSMIDQTALDAVQEPVTAPSMIDQAAIDTAEQPIASTGLGSLVDQSAIDAAEKASSQAVTDAYNVDLAGVGQQGWEALPGTTSYQTPGITIPTNAITQLASALTSGTSGTGTTPVGQPSTTQGYVPSGGTSSPLSTPWITKPEAGFLTYKGAPSKPEEDTSQILAGLDPLLRNLFQKRGILAADGGSISDYFKSMGSEISSLSPKFVNTTPKLLEYKRQLSSSAGSPSLLKQISSSISRVAVGGLPKQYQDASPKGHHPEFVTGLTGFYADGRGTGQSDDIPALLHDGDYVMDAETVSALGDGSSKAGRDVLEKFRQQVPHEKKVGGHVVPAQIADGEYVFPASFVTALGKGDNKRGAEILDGLREKLRAHKRKAPLDKIPPKAKSPLEYMKTRI